MMAERLLAKPIFGGPFGEGQYSLATVPVVAAGLHAVQFMVIEPSLGRVLALGDDKTKVLAEARRVVAAADLLRAANDEKVPTQRNLWDEMPVPASGSRASEPVSRRRRAIHARTAGRCFYCSEPLELQGPWHVDHQFPRALGGDDSPVNLVPACPRCNRRKSDRTGLEFVLSESGA